MFLYQARTLLTELVVEHEKNMFYVIPTDMFYVSHTDMFLYQARTLLTELVVEHELPELGAISLENLIDGMKS